MRIELEVPKVIAEYIDINSENYKRRISHIMLYGLVKSEKISIGKAAEAMEDSKKADLNKEDVK